MHLPEEAKSDAARMARAEFLEPETATSPRSGTPPIMTMRSSDLEIMVSKKELRCGDDSCSTYWVKTTAAMIEANGKSLPLYMKTPTNKEICRHIGAVPATSMAANCLACQAAAS